MRLLAALSTRKRVGFLGDQVVTFSERIGFMMISCVSFIMRKPPRLLLTVLRYDELVVFQDVIYGERCSRHRFDPWMFAAARTTSSSFRL